MTSQEELLSLAYKLAGKIMRNSPTAIKAAIKAVNANYDSSLNGYAVEIEEFGKCFGTEDFKEGTTAFRKKKAELLIILFSNYSQSAPSVNSRIL